MRTKLSKTRLLVSEEGSDVVNYTMVPAEVNAAQNDTIAAAGSVRICPTYADQVELNCCLASDLVEIAMAELMRERNLNPSRELSSTITKLDEALHWLRDQKES